MHPDLNFTRPIFPNQPPPILSLFCISPSSWPLALPPSPRYSVLTFPNSSPLLKTLPQSATLPLSFSRVFPPAYLSSLFLTSAYSSSLLINLPHSSKLFGPPLSLTNLPSCSPFISLLIPKIGQRYVWGRVLCSNI